MSWLSAFFGEFEGKSLQRSGKLSKEQLLMFFEHGAQLFNNREFKKALSMAFRAGQSAQELVDQAQAKVWEDKVQPAVQGDFGLRSLQHALTQYGSNDAEFTRIFYQFVHLEERTLDEAEMPPEAFNTKYEQLDRMKAEMEAAVKEQEDKMTGMTEEERQQFMANMYKRIVDTSLSMSSNDPCCGPSTSCGPRPPAPGAPTEAPQVEELPSLRGGAAHSHDDHDCPQLVEVPGGQALSEAQNMAFFKTMNR